MVRLKRVYDPPAPEDGYRVLVELLWPRGVTRERARIDAWLKDLAPTPALRRWYRHDPARWGEFRQRYREELASPRAQELLGDLAQRARAGTVTLVFATRDVERSGAAVLHEVLEELGSAAPQ